MESLACGGSFEPVQYVRKRKSCLNIGFGVEFLNSFSAFDIDSLCNLGKVT